jgi:acetyltransferase-like isoleucine patch superfamily enzyme
MTVRERNSIKRGNIPATVWGQLKKSSSERNMNIILFGFKRFLNYFLETIAYNCPLNTWRVQFHRWRGVHIEKNVHIGRRCTLDHAYPEYIYIKERVALTGDVYILTHSTTLDSFENSFDSYVAPVVIEEGVLLGIRVTILPGVTIGKGSVISAGTVINKDVPPNTVVAVARNRTIPISNGNENL